MKKMLSKALFFVCRTKVESNLFERDAKGGKKNTIFLVETLKNKSSTNVKSMNNSKKLEISKNDISIKNDIPSQYEKAEKIL